MGGYGSGRYHGMSSRQTVEDCLSLDANKLAKWGYFKPGWRSGKLTWSRGQNETGSCGFYTYINEVNASITFHYSYRDERHSDVKINLSWYSPGFGGRRYYFICPHCNRRMRTLHINGGEIACRICHNLTYESCNESHHFDRLYKNMALDLNTTWQEVKECLNSMKRQTRIRPKRPRGRPRKNSGV